MHDDFRKNKFLSLLRETATGCQEFIGWRDSFGYGRFKYRSQGKWVGRAAHRHAMQIALNRELKPDEVCRHACDNPSCCNINHLSIGTQMDNVADRQARNRTAVGERNGQSRLSNSQAAQIRISALPVKHLSKIYGVHHSTISRVRRGLQHQPQPKNNPND